MNDDAPRIDRPSLLKSFIKEGDPPRRRLSIGITVLARLLRNSFDRKVASLNVTRSQWTMIATVARFPGSTQRAIADSLEMSEASAGRLIDKLCAEGLLVRRERYDDRRARAVHPTQSACELLEALSLLANENEKAVFAGFSDEELQQMCGYMERMYANASRV